MTTLKLGRTIDARFLRLFTGGLSVQQVESSVDEAILNIKKLLNDKNTVSKRLSLNIIRGESQGYGYLFIEDKRYTNIMAGFNADGSKREKLVQDPNWVPGKKIKVDYTGLSWAEVSELEEEEEKAELPTMISEPLPTLVQMPEYKYTNMQKADHKRVLTNGLKYEMYTTMKTEAERKGRVFKLSHDEIMKLDISDAAITIPESFRIEVSYAHVSDHEYDDTYKHNVLFAKGFPSWVQENDIYRAMANLASTNATTSVKVGMRNNKAVYQTKPYPIVNISNNGGQLKAFVTFDPRTRDARFALMVCKFLKVENASKQSTTLKFQKALK